MKTLNLPQTPEVLKAARDAHDSAAIVHMRAAKRHLREGERLARQLQQASDTKGSGK